MRNLAALVAVSAISLGVGGATAASANDIVGGAAAPPAARLISGVYTAGDPGQFEKTQYVWGGRRYCWYAGGWHGPGYYYCGYAWRRGHGWGGPVGWRGWGRPGRHDGDRHGRRDHEGWRGDRGDRGHGDRHPH